VTVSAIVAASQNGVIGRGNTLPWNLPDDLAHFRKITSGHPVIMGRKTHESIGRALPGRQNIVISRDNDYRAEGCETVGSLEEALEAAADTDEAFIIGGGTIYELAMPKLDKIYLTEVKADIDGDTFFKFDRAGWQMLSSEEHQADSKNQYGFEFQEWRRK
jgi:dihydrofolate reductase